MVHNIDWSTAEALAFGSLLEEGYPVRLSWSRLRKRNVSVKDIQF